MQVKKINSNKRSRLLVVGAVLIVAVGSQAGSQYEMKKSVFASGGHSQQGPYTLHGAIGQNTTTKSTSASYQVSAGFYQENRDLIFFNQFDGNQ